ncbi:MAG TPA: helix-turn-helix domain-containing protein, partial [Nitrolancea sp.]|nr:helix-turn-helix domain-containing protein [Nitrolancea sp.]
MKDQGHQSFGALLRSYREAAGLTQSELAERAGISTNAVGMLERGERRQPQPHTLRQLAVALDLSAAERARFLASTTERADAGQRSDQRSHPLHALPAPVTRFIGRQRELAELRQLLSEFRLITLTGVGGAGKTRLAIEVARQSRDVFPGGTHFVNLAPIDDPALVALTIESGLGAEQVPGASPLERIVSCLGDRQILLVLDNLEQVVEAAPVISAVLASAPNVRVLATSRVVLHLYGECEFRVPPLSLANQDVPESIEQAEAVHLFVQSARATRRDFAPDAATLAVVAKICERLDGLPLAIELAAARTRFFAPQDLLDRLTNRLEPLTSDGRDVPE